MATARDIRNLLWALGGFPNCTALEKKVVKLRTSGLLRPSLRGAGANHLNSQELACAALALPGEADGVTRALAFLRDRSGQTLRDRLALLLFEGAESILAGRQPREIAVTLCTFPAFSARLDGAGPSEHFGTADERPLAGVRKFTEITPGVWAVLCELAANSERKKTRQGNVSGVRSGSRGISPGTSTDYHTKTATPPLGDEVAVQVTVAGRLLCRPKAVRNSALPKDTVAPYDLVSNPKSQHSVGDGEGGFSPKKENPRVLKSECLP